MRVFKRRIGRGCWRDTAQGVARRCVFALGGPFSRSNGWAALEVGGPFVSPEGLGRKASAAGGRGFF